MTATALDLVAAWPVPNASAAVVADGGLVGTTGDTSHVFRLASLSKMLTSWATLVAVEEGIVTLEQRVDDAGCTLRHLLAHAGGYPFEGTAPIAQPGQRRIYSNTGIELAASAVETAAGMPFGEYLAAAVFEPLGMATTTLDGSPAHGVRSCVDDLVSFLAEVQHPTLVTAATAADATSPQYAELAGIVPGVGRFDPCPWGLGFEIRGGKSPHWTGQTNSPATFGHFGGAGTMAWVDPAVGRGLVALTDRSFEDWSIEAMRCWPALSDAVVAEAAAG